MTSAFTHLFVPPPVEPIVAVVKGSFMIFPPFLARFVAMTETYLINVGAAMRSVPFDAAAAAAAAEEAERLAAIGRVSLDSEGLAILAVLLFSFASVAGAALLAMYPEGDVLRGVKEAFVEAKEMSSPGRRRQPPGTCPGSRMPRMPAVGSVPRRRHPRGRLLRQDPARRVHGAGGERFVKARRD